jgi:hypothetical protein
MTLPKHPTTAPTINENGCSHQNQGHTPSCVHWWLLPPQDGPTVQGICKKCGAKRVFSAVFDEQFRYGRLYEATKWLNR